MEPESPAERAIREAIERGEFRDLEAAGRPLPHDGTLDDERWAATHVMRTANAVPEWIDLRREIDDETSRLVRRAHGHLRWLAARRGDLRLLPADRIQASARATDERDARFRRELSERVVALNTIVARHNLLVPGHLQLQALRDERILELAKAKPT